MWLAVALAITLRLLYVHHPLDQRLLNAWREADYVQIARNFYRGDLNLLYPQIDWRRDTPGYVEMELPIVPWLAAVCCRLFGYSEVWLRYLSALFSIASLVPFVWLCRRLLPPSGSVLALTAFAVSPILVTLSTSMQPEPLMLMSSLLAMCLIWRYGEAPTFLNLLAAAGATAAASLTKLPAAHLALVLAFLVLRRKGRGALLDARVIVAALVAALPVLAWHGWARHFWVEYGNSLGVSNESHFIGLDMLIPPRFLLGNISWEVLVVLAPPGVLLTLAALRCPKARLAFLWYGAVWVFYSVAARTSGDRWAWYYHGLGVPPACLLMGHGLAALTTNAAFARNKDLPRRSPRVAARQRVVGWGLALATVLVLLVGTTYKLYKLHHGTSQTPLAEMYLAARALLPHVPATGAIVVGGPSMFDQYGMPVAHDASMFFGWMDRKGFVYGAEELSIETLDAIAARGGRYWIVSRDGLADAEFLSSVRRRYRLVAETHTGFCLYDLQSRPN
ncbi:MAG: glycosyltransferase family 39 protein [Planctomycetota bacterium]